MPAASRRSGSLTRSPSTVTDASLTLQQLVAAIQVAGGPTYEFRQIDPVDDQGPHLAERPEALFDLVVDGRDARVAFERYRQESRRFVDDDEAIVFVDHVEIADDADARTGFRAAWTIHPEPNLVALVERSGRVGHQRFDAVDVDLAALEGGGRLAAGAEALRGCEKLVEAGAGFSRVDGPVVH